jgi:uncharacterized protein
VQIDNDPFTPLSEAEIELLDQFLLDRIDDDEESIEMDEGIINISELDGFFTAIVSGPDIIQPSRWLPVVWGDYEPAWESEEAFMVIISMLMRHMNAIAEILIEHSFDYEPLYLEHTVENKTYTIVDEWCEGYLRGMNLLADQWQEAGEEMVKLLTPIYAFTEETNWQGHNYPESELKLYHQAISRNAQEIHAYWLAQRSVEPQKTLPFTHQGPRVSLNDPCPCGSGKKYKKCCLH